MNDQYNNVILHRNIERPSIEMIKEISEIESIILPSKMNEGDFIDALVIIILIIIII